MKKNKNFRIAGFSIMVVWFSYQAYVLPDGYQRNFILVMILAGLHLIYATVYGLKPLFKNREDADK